VLQFWFKRDLLDDMNTFACCFCIHIERNAPNIYWSENFFEQKLDRKICTRHRFFKPYSFEIITHNGADVPEV
jgi:hypothetical protein